jgi:hypothetical protein
MSQEMENLHHNAWVDLLSVVFKLFLWSLELRDADNFVIRYKYESGGRKMQQK